jgi:orotate phosphoribosyltransferase
MTSVRDADQRRRRGRIDETQPAARTWVLPTSAETGTLSEKRDRLIDIVASKGLLTLDEPVRLASGDLSRHFIDGKRALANGRDLKLACEALVELADENGVVFDAVGGMTLGADQFSHGVALLTGCDWFVVRKQVKGRGTNRRIEGVELGPERRVLLVDDVVTRGGSIQEAYSVIAETGALVQAAVTLVDRGTDTAPKFFAETGVPYLPLVTHDRLGIPAVDREFVEASATR